MPGDFRERDPTNPIDAKVERDRMLKSGETYLTESDPSQAELDGELDRLAKKYEIDPNASGHDGERFDDDDFGTDEPTVEVTIEQARAWGKRDGVKAVELAREQPANDGIEIMDTKALSRPMGVPAVDEPGSPARLVCSQRAYMNQGIYWGPHLPLAGLISEEASLAFQSDDEEVGQGYWDAFELEARRANVSIVTATHQEMFDDGPTLALYVVDRNRFPVFNEKEATNYSTGDDFYVEETLIQFAFQPEKTRLSERLTRPFRRSR